MCFVKIKTSIGKYFINGSNIKLDDIESIAKRTVAFVEVLKNLGFYKDEIISLAIEYFKKLAKDKVTIDYDRFRKFIEEYREFNKAEKKDIKNKLCKFLMDNEVPINQELFNNKGIVRIEVPIENRKRLMELVQEFIDREINQ